METTKRWIKQENAIPAWVAHKARSALKQRVSTRELPTVSTTRITALLQDGNDADSDAGRPGVYYLREGDKSSVESLSHKMLRKDVRTWPFVFTPTSKEKSSFAPAARDRAWTIIALQIVTYSSGLPALGEAEEKMQLSPGDALHFLGDVPQTYGEHGGGLCTMIEWRYY